MLTLMSYSGGANPSLFASAAVIIIGIAGMGIGIFWIKTSAKILNGIKKVREEYRNHTDPVPAETLTGWIVAMLAHYRENRTVIRQMALIGTIGGAVFLAFGITNLIQGIPPNRRPDSRCPRSAADRRRSRRATGCSHGAVATTAAGAGPLRQGRGWRGWAARAAGRSALVARRVSNASARVRGSQPIQASRALRRLAAAHHSSTATHWPSHSAICQPRSPATCATGK